MNKRLSALLSDINILENHGPDPYVTGVSYDSRTVKPGHVFFALPGIHANGHRYIDQAIASGAAAVFHEEDVTKQEGVAYIKVGSTRCALSPLSAAFYGKPSNYLTVTGVTGTDGKSTVVYFLYQLLNLSGKRCGYFSTVGMSDGATEMKNPMRQSTPEAPEIQKFLSDIIQAGCTHAVVEATSHGLSPKTNRLGDVCFAGGILTNVTREHLEFHGTVENYRKDKSRLFSSVSTEKSNSFSIINRDDEHWDFFTDASSAPVFTYSVKHEDVHLYAKSIRPKSASVDAVISDGKDSSEISLPIPGEFNIENLLAALLGASKAANKHWKELIRYIPQLKPVPGRMKPVQMGQEFNVIIDYAHTPGSFSKLFPMMRKTCTGKIIAVFGSAGERDTEKRPIQGKIASQFSDIIILTNEDPRLEDEITILDEIAAGCTLSQEAIYKIPERTKAIRKAFSLASTGDTVLLLGKGHESSIIYSEGPVYWNEEEAAQNALADLGYSATIKSMNQGE
ncbi:MAG: UDP-N-acetylmuramoyl-L-alanyl-D-glutamate--2,6-diaminopimelate ligase [Spirochaetia bacterium]